MKARLSLLLFLAVFATSCGLLGDKGGRSMKSSSTTGWEYNNPDNGGFQSDPKAAQLAGPGLKFIEGGTFTMGRVDQDVMYKWDNAPRRVTVASFYMDECEVANIDWREYLHWLHRVYPDAPQKYQQALPDTLVWRSEMAYNEPWLKNYLRHPAFSDYPVVGVSWEQAEAYCKWRTDRVNEQILVQQGILEFDPLSQQGQNVFTTETYLASLYQGKDGKKPKKDASGNARRVRWEDGVLLPDYRLPTEAEWEYAAYGLIGNADGELLTERRIYPWQGSYMRSNDNKTRGEMQANYVRGRGDMMGMAGALNDGGEITVPVTSYRPNDYGLYCMAGNVSEWVADVYRPLSQEDVNEFQPYRGAVYTNPKKDSDGKPIVDEFGNMVKDTVADFRNYDDGDYQSQLIEGNDWNAVKEKAETSDIYVRPKTGPQSLISDEARVYKGGSWKDRAYWLSPGTRRFKDQKNSAIDIGFRCAMSQVGSPRGIE
ncbi:MAG: SUMF1/EgtB/PvdO family nonheme iron enzyme [Mangrovibacterium sp.]